MGQGPSPGSGPGSTSGGFGGAVGSAGASLPARFPARFLKMLVDVRPPCAILCATEMGRRRAQQGSFEFRSWGGPRKGAGRKPKGERPMVSRRKRAALASRFPVHVTMKLRCGLGSLRRKAERELLFEVFATGGEAEGFRVVQFSLQRDHIHLIAEGIDRPAFSRGMQGLAVRIARGLNRLWGRRGPVFADRYHDRVLRTPKEVRNALRYVLANGKKHGSGAHLPVDINSSGPWFDGWCEKLEVRGLEVFATPTARAHTWLLRVGWRRHGLIGFDEVPGPRTRKPHEEQAMPPRRGAHRCSRSLSASSRRTATGSPAGPGCHPPSWPQPAAAKSAGPGSDTR